MRNKRRTYWFFLGAIILLMACSKVPDGILSEKEMQKVMTDMLLAEAMTGTDYKKFKDNETKEALYHSVFRKHGITQADYDSSLVWYGRNLDIYMKVYERVLTDLKKQITDLGDVQADAAPVSNRDSVNIWPRRSFLALQPKSVFNGVTFDIKPESSYSSGSIFVLGTRVWGLNEKKTSRPEIRLSADQGDTIITVNNRIEKDGYHETILKTVPTKKVKHVYGYIRLNDMDTTYYRIYLDSLNLMKYNYGKEFAGAVKDSIR